MPGTAMASPILMSAKQNGGILGIGSMIPGFIGIDYYANGPRFGTSFGPEFYFVLRGFCA